MSSARARCARLARVALLGGLWLLPATGAAQGGVPTPPVPPPAAPAATAPAAAPTRYGLQDTTLQVFAGESLLGQVALPCAGSLLQLAGGRLHVGCATGTALTFDLTDPARPQLVSQRELPGPVTGLHEAGGRVWAEITRVEARPLDEAPAAAFPGPAGAGVPTTPAVVSPPVADQPAAGPVATGTVVETAPGRVLVDLGTGAGLKRGDHVGLYLVTTVQLGEGSGSEEEELLAVGEVTAVAANRAAVRLGLNERVSAGARARRVTRALTENRFVPPRVDGIWEAGFMARPFLALGDFGFGMVSDAQVGLRHPSNLHLLLLLEPAGLGYASEGNVLALAGNVLAAFDTTVFEIGLGLGWSAVNQDLGGDESSRAGGGSLDADIDQVKSGLSIAQLARLGARDGLHLLVRNNFLLYDDEFNYGGTVAEVQVPVSARSWLLARGGGGQAGYAYGEVGLRWLARGNGDRGSLFLTVAAGGGALSGEQDRTGSYLDGQGQEVTYEYTETVSYGGPMVGFGAEWRL